MSNRYKVLGMTCGGCAAGVERAIKAAAPDAVVRIDLKAAEVCVEGADEAVVAAAVDGAGFGFAGAL